MKKEQLEKAISERKAVSAWSKGVKDYALMLLEEFDGDEFFNSPADKKALLNGASSWEEYSEGGCALVYDFDIARQLCTPSELKRTNDGERMPNARENWIDCQARALTQAEILISKAYNSKKGVA